MFHFPAYPPDKSGAGPYGRRVPPFGNPRIKALSAAPRGLSRPHTSFIGTVCQGIHHTPQHPQTTNAHSARTTTQKTTSRSNRSIHPKKLFGTITAQTKQAVRLASLASTIQFSNHHTTHGAPEPTGPGDTMRIRPRVAAREPNSMHRPQKQPLTLFHASPANRPPPWTSNPRPKNLRRKEVIQPHLPVRLPCYDLVPITSLTLDGSPHKG